jgi:hypothetical protein
MKSVLTKCCDTLEKRLYSNIPRETLLNNCAQERLYLIYKKENDEFDKLIGKLESYIDYNSPKQVNDCVVRMLRLLSKNRKRLFNSLKELC